MPPQRPKEHQCQRCGRAYTSLMRLQHHQAADHDLKAFRDIHTTRDLACPPGRR